MKLSNTDLQAIRERLTTYPVQAQADLLKLLECVSDKQATKRQAKPVGYSPTFEQAWAAYPRKVGKADAYKTWCARLVDGLTEDQLLRITQAYIKDQKAKSGYDVKYVLHFATLFGAQSRRYEDYIQQPVSNPTQEPDWWEPAQKLIRDMPLMERIKSGVPTPLPDRLNVDKNFGR